MWEIKVPVELQKFKKDYIFRIRHLKRENKSTGSLGDSRQQHQLQPAIRRKKISQETEYLQPEIWGQEKLKGDDKKQRLYNRGQEKLGDTQFREAGNLGKR